MDSIYARPVAYSQQVTAGARAENAVCAATDLQASNFGATVAFDHPKVMA